MNLGDLMSLLPLALIALCSLVVVLVAAFTRRLSLAFGISAAGLVLALLAILAVWPLLPYSVAGLLSFDGFVLFGFFLIIAATLSVAISSWTYLRRRSQEGGDFYFLLLLSALGGCVLAAASAFATFFLGLELMSVSLYALIGWRRDRAIGTEAAIKYLVLAGISSAFLLFGMAMIYADTGSMDLARLSGISLADGLVGPVGLGMMLVGIGFKLAVVPFHLWTPDVYDGAPAPVTGFIATVSKGAMVVVLVRAFAPSLVGSGGIDSMSSAAIAPISPAFPWVIAIVAGLSMFGGNILALRESNVKRILAYSSIAHLGYILVAFLAGGTNALRAVSFYLVTYFATTLGAFAVIAEMSTEERDADSLEDFKALAGRRPWMAAALTAMLLSLAGLPLTAGFVGKFIILTAGAGAQLWTLAVILAVNGTISIFYYLKIVSAMFRGFSDGTATTETAAVSRIPFLAACALAILVIAVVALGVYPSPLLSFLGSLSAGGF